MEFEVRAGMKSQHGIWDLWARSLGTSLLGDYNGPEFLGLLQILRRGCYTMVVIYYQIFGWANVDRKKV